MLSLVGIGGAGCSIVDTFYRKDPFSSIVSRLSHTKEDITGVAIDTSETLDSLKNIPPQNKLVIGKSTAKGHGAGGNVEMGRRIMKEEMELALNTIRKANQEKPDIFILVAGLGGGTGTGGAGLVAEMLKKYYNTPVVGVFILPSRAEGSHYVKNAYSNFDSLRGSVDASLLQDINVLLNRGEDIARSRKIVSKSIIRFFNIAEARDLLPAISGDVCAFGSMKLKRASISAKDALEKLLREHIHFETEGKRPEKFILFLRDNMEGFYGEKFGAEWLRNKYGARLEVTRRHESGSKNLEVGLVIKGIETQGQKQEERGEGEEKSIPSDLEDLLGDIQSL